MLGNSDGLQAALVALLSGIAQSGNGAGPADELVGVQLPELAFYGIPVELLRWLSSKGYIAEISQQCNANRGMAAESPLLEPSCKSAFVLTEAGLAFARNVLTSDAVPSFDGCSGAGLPVWHADSHESFLRGLLVKQFKQPAPTQELILSVFQEENWRTHIDDPLPPQAETVSSHRLHAAVRNLNRHQKHRLIRFESDGHGEGICWHPRPEDS